MKVKVNVGCSNKIDSVETEKEKIRYALAREVDYISEISLVTEKKKELLEFISSLEHGQTKFCTVPLYDAVLNQAPIFQILQEHYDHGIRCFTWHLTPRHLIRASVEQNFVINSRAGHFLYDLAKRDFENPHFAVFQEMMAFVREKGCELFIGTSLRPGRVGESKTSRLWIEELNFIKAFMKQQGVNENEFILECGGHLDISQLDSFVETVADHQICVMGPLLTDATNSFDDLSSIIGATVLHSRQPLHTHLMLTRDEHIRLPTLEAFRNGTDTALILKHNLNLANRDDRTLNLEDRFRNQSNQCTTGVNLFGPLKGDPQICTMCGRHCPLRNIKYPTAPLIPSPVLASRRVAP